MRHILTTLCISLIAALATAQNYEVVTSQRRERSGNVTLTFADTPLPEALRLIDQSQSDKNIYFIYNELEPFRVTKQITSQPALSAVKSVCKNLPVKVKSKDSDIFVNAKREDQKPVGHLVLSGRVLDFKTRNDVVGAHVQLLTPDSTVIAQEVAENKCMDGAKTWYQSDFYLIAPRVENTNYILKITMMGYRTLYQDVHVGSLPASLDRMALPMLLMREDSKLLDEVTVSATKVKFYHRGDTVVYNADAFILAEGSMLDALVRQMPGVEIKPNGDIYHNGRLVQELLLNGKELFSKDRRVMLENLPTYMVKQIEIYDRQTDRAKFLGDDSPAGKLYAMDVRLKKEYSIGWIANIEAGGGLADKDYRGDAPYLGRLFALRFTDHSRLAFYANANNLNDSRKPGQDDSWTPSSMQEGIQTEQLAGIDYNLDSRSKVWKLRGEAQFSHSVLNNETSTFRTNFLPTGDTRERIIDTERNKNLSLTTSHDLTVTRSHLMLTVYPTLSYRRFDLTTATESEAWSDTLINRYLRSGLRRGHDWQTGLTARSTIKFDNTSDYVELNAGASYSNRKDDTFSRHDIRYGQAQTLADRSDQYFKNHPDHDYSINASALYSHRLNQHFSLTVTYSVAHSQAERHSDLYLLDQMDDYQQGDIGVLPSVAEYLSTLDPRNSYRSQHSETTHTLLPNLTFHHNNERGSWYSELRLPLSLKSRRLDYQRGAIDTTLTHTDFLPAVTNSFLTWTSRDNRTRYGLWFTHTTRTPDMLRMVSLRDDTDPLNIHEGNPALRKSRESQLRYVFSSGRTLYQRAELEFNTIADAISMAVTFDPATGIRTHRSANVNGNWRMGATYDFGIHLDPKRRLRLSGTTTLRHRQNADIIGSGGQLRRSTVQTENIFEELRLSYSRSGQTVSLKASADYRNMHSPRPDFADLNVWNFQYGLAGTFALPWQLQLSTDLTMFSRRGYSDAALNTNDLVWNARLARSFAKGRLTCMLDAFDILRQLSSITYNVNAQGRTEIRRNVLPRYAMLHVQWKLNKEPKKNR